MKKKAIVGSLLVASMIVPSTVAFAKETKSVQKTSSTSTVNTNVSDAELYKAFQEGLSRSNINFIAVVANEAGVSFNEVKNSYLKTFQGSSSKFAYQFRTQQLKKIEKESAKYSSPKQFQTEYRKQLSDYKKAFSKQLTEVDKKFKADIKKNPKLKPTPFKYKKPVKAPAKGPVKAWG